jgi:hypothetical protein
LRRLGLVGLLAAFALASCFTSGGGGTGGEGAVLPGGLLPPIDQHHPAVTESATFALG